MPSKHIIRIFVLNTLKTESQRCCISINKSDCVTGIGQEIFVVLFYGSDNEDNEIDNMFIKSTVGIDDASSMILILFMNKSTDITDMQHDLFPLSLAQILSVYQKQIAFRMF
jgi:hypothetical protein